MRRYGRGCPYPFSNAERTSLVLSGRFDPFCTGVLGCMEILFELFADTEGINGRTGGQIWTLFRVQSISK